MRAQVIAGRSFSRRSRDLGGREKAREKGDIHLFRTLIPFASAITFSCHASSSRSIYRPMFVTRSCWGRKRRSDLRRDPMLTSTIRQGALMSATRSNQETIIGNQGTIVRNQRTITSNQKTIIANQARILSRGNRFYAAAA